MKIEMSRRPTSPRQEFDPLVPAGHSYTWYINKNVPYRYGAVTFRPPRHAHIELFQTQSERNKAYPNVNISTRYFKFRRPVMVEKSGKWVQLVPKRVKRKKSELYSNR